MGKFQKEETGIEGLVVITPKVFPFGIFRLIFFNATSMVVG